MSLALKVQNDEILEALSSQDFNQKHEDVLRSTYVGTNTWVFESETYKAWRATGAVAPDPAVVL